jgi:hypothetical protein
MMRMAKETSVGDLLAPPAQAPTPHRPGEPNITPDEAPLVCVLSLSRSGSSLVARVLQEALGVDFGDPIDHLPPNRFNPDGYFENLKIVDLNDEILQAAGGSVLLPPHREFFAESERYSVYTNRLSSVLGWLGQGRALFGIKDPRLALTFPLYRKAWPTLVPIIAFRNPLSAASSIAEQTGLAFTAALDLWYEYYYRILLYTTGLPRYVLSFERLMEAPAEVALGLARHLGVERSPEEIGARVEGIVDPRKVHHGWQVELPEFSPYLDAKAKLLYRCLHEPARQGRQPDFAHLGKLVGALDFYETHYRPGGVSKTSANHLEDQAQRLRDSFASREAEVAGRLASLEDREREILNRERDEAHQQAALALERLGADRDEQARAVQARDVEIAALREQLAAEALAVDSERAEVSRLRQALAHLEARATAEEARLEKLALTLLSSNSWRLTAPLRRMRAAAHRARARLAISLRAVRGYHPTTKAPPRA